MRPVSIVPSVLPADFAKLGEECAALEAAGVDRIQWDVMDGVFVPNLTFGPDVIAACRKHVEVPFEAHLMVVEPDELLPRYVEAGCELLIVHAEACRHLHRTLGRIRDLGVVPIPGTSFLRHFRDAYVNNLGEWRIGQAYGMRSFARFGIIAAASSDAPVVPVDALAGVQTMVTRRDILGRPCNPEEAVPLEDALRAYTVNGAYASSEEEIKGTLRPGLLGDVTVFETDLFAVDPVDLAAVRVDCTIVEGEVVYER